MEMDSSIANAARKITAGIIKTRLKMLRWTLNALALAVLVGGAVM